MKRLNDDKQYHEALKLFHQYERKNVSNLSDKAINQALKACSNLKDLEYGSIIHNRLSNQSMKNDKIITSLINFYMQCRDLNNAQKLFNTIPNRTVAMYGAIMKGYLTNNMPEKVIEIFKEIRNPDHVIFTFLLNACSKVKNIEAFGVGKNVFSKMSNKDKTNQFVLSAAFDMFIQYDEISSAEELFPKLNRSVIHYGALMKGYNRQGDAMKTLSLFNRLKNERIKIDQIIFVLVINACSQIGSLIIGQSIVEQIPQQFLADYRIQCALIDMWGKAGSVDKANEIFEKVEKPNTAIINAMINSYGLNGFGMKAIELFRQFPSDNADELTYICVLNACSHSGLVSEAYSIFETIRIKTDKIFTTMVDCLSRASHFDAAERLIEQFEQNHLPYWPMHMALLSGARNQCDSQYTEKVFHRMKNKFSKLQNVLTPASVLLANVFASKGDFDKASNIKQALVKSGVKKTVGLSWTVVNGEVVKFRAHDRSHPQSKEIFAELDRISQDLIEYGHRFNSSWITRPIEDGETIESVLCGHSEKLALAFNFIQRPIPSIIQITKNLRVCGDCHAATKLLARIRQCQIIVRDANRIHHFYPNGQCSCNDYF